MATKKLTRLQCPLFDFHKMNTIQVGEAIYALKDISLNNEWYVYTNLNTKTLADEAIKLIL